MKVDHLPNKHINSICENSKSLIYIYIRELKLCEHWIFSNFAKIKIFSSYLHNGVGFHMQLVASKDLVIVG